MRRLLDEGSRATYHAPAMTSVTTTIDHRLEELSVAQRLVRSLNFAPAGLEFAVHPDGNRASLPFRLTVAPSSGDSEERVGRYVASVSNTLNPLLPEPSSCFGLALVLPPFGAEELYYQDPVANPQQAADDAPPTWIVLEPIGDSHPSVQAEVLRIFGAPLEPLAAREATTLTARVIGHRLARSSNRYAHPGSGTWTLLRVVDPCDAWLGLDLGNGWGEVFAAGPGADARAFADVALRTIA